MEYYSSVINMRLLQNHINNDPIIDWFEIQNIKNIIYNKDKNNYFRKYILNETISYKNKFFNNLKKKILEIHPNKIIYKTFASMKSNYPNIAEYYDIERKFWRHTLKEYFIYIMSQRKEYKNEYFIRPNKGDTLN